MDIFFFRKSKPVVLPDVVATLSSDEKSLESPNQDKIILEKLEEENLRLKAIFKLHSIKIQEDGGGGGGEASTPDQARRRSSCGSARVSSISSESSSASVQSCKVEIA